MIRIFKIVLSLTLLFPALALAVPYCSDIFTDPPTGEHGENGLTPPANIGPPLGELNCTRKGGCDNSTSGYFLPGDYSFSEGNFHGGGPSLVNHITTNGTTARLYFDRVSLSGVSLNTYGKAEDLIIYVREDLTIAGHNHINGIIYVLGNVSLSGNGSVTGGLAAGGSAGVGGNGDFVFDEEAIDNADFGGMCIPGPKPDLNHYRLEFSSGALSCKAKDILIRACADENCTTETSVLSSVDLTKNGGVYSTVNFTGHTVPAAELWHADGGTVLVGLGATAPSGSYRCFIDGVEVGNIADCRLTFEDTGFYFDVPDTISNKNSDQFELFAATKDPVTQKCDSLFKNQTKSVDFSFNYKDPSPVNNPASLTLTAPTQSKVIAGGSTESVSVQFDAEGKALLTVNYPEAGEVTLKASHIHTVSTPSGSEELLLEHQDSFIAKPAGFHFFNVSTDRCESSDPYDGNCKVLAKAGENFEMRMKAVGWKSDGDSNFSDNPALQNFKHSNIPIQAAVEVPSLADGGTDGSFSTSAVDFNLSDSESSQLISQSWNEVGTVTAKLTQDISYLGVTISKENASSELFGRFTPTYLDISGNSPSLTHSCSSFTYMDQPFGFSGGGEPIIQVRGMASGGNETSNYQIGDWWRYKHKEEADRNQWSGRSYEDKTGELQAQDSEYPGLSGSVSYANNANIATLTGAKVEYVRLPTPMVPFDAKFDLKLTATDVTDEDGICYKADSSGSCQPFSFEDIADGASFELRYGRLFLENGYGPESESLRLPLRTEYVSAVTEANIPTWSTNVKDSCSPYDTHSSADSGETVTQGVNMTYPSGFPEIEAYTDSSLSSQVDLLNAGLGYLFFEAPNAPGEVPFKLHVEPWLKWYWNFDGNKPNDLYDPRASAFFGTYRGHDKVIYWHEVN